jgi:hypothetical protein
MDGVPEAIRELLREEARRGRISFHPAADALEILYPQLRKHWEEQLLGDEAVRALARQRFDYLSGYRGQRWEEAHESIRREEEGRARTFLEAALEARRSTRAAIDATKGGEG